MLTFGELSYMEQPNPILARNLDEGKAFSWSMGWIPFILYKVGCPLNVETYYLLVCEVLLNDSFCGFDAFAIVYCWFLGVRTSVEGVCPEGLGSPLGSIFGCSEDRFGN
jgi:hypothetical protein